MRGTRVKVRVRIGTTYRRPILQSLGYKVEEGQTHWMENIERKEGDGGLAAGKNGFMPLVTVVDFHHARSVFLYVGLRWR